MTDPSTTSDPANPGAEPAAPPPARPPTYQRDAATQTAFDSAAAFLRQHDSWADDKGVRRLNTDLVLEGGGVKGIGFAGAVLVLAEAGYHFKRVAGTSAGAIAATLIAAIEKAGKDMTVITDYLGRLQFDKFLNEGPLRHLAGKLHLATLADGTTLITHMGLYSGDYLAEWLTPILQELGVSTFADLRITDDPGMSLPEDHQYTLVVHTSDISRGELVHLPWDYGYYGVDRDGQDVVGAVRASMSIPFFFEPVRFASIPATVKVRQPGGTFVDQTYPGGQVTWVDGGMLANFPIDAFDRIDGAPPRWPTIGIKLSAQPLEMATDVPAGNTWAEAFRCLQTMLNEWDRYHVDQTSADRTIFVDNRVTTTTDGKSQQIAVSATDFHLTPEVQQQLFLNGARAATDFVIAKANTGGVLHPTAAV
jgi:NTE family protein